MMIATVMLIEVVWLLILITFIELLQTYWSSVCLSMQWFQSTFDIIALYSLMESTTNYHVRVNGYHHMTHALKHCMIIHLIYCNKWFKNNDN